MQTTLKEMMPKEDAIILSVGVKGSVRQRLIDMGLTPGTKVTMRKAAPFGDPIEIHLRGYDLSLRKAEAEQVMVEKN